MEVPCWEGKFSIMDFYLAPAGKRIIAVIYGKAGTD